MWGVWDQERGEEPGKALPCDWRLLLQPTSHHAQKSHGRGQGQACALGCAGSHYCVKLKETKCLIKSEVQVNSVSNNCVTKENACVATVFLMACVFIQASDHRTH